MADAPNFNLVPNFPIAGVADLIAQRPYKEALMQQAQREQLMQGLKDFGSGVSSLVNRRQQMAQALAASQMMAQTPEGQQMLGTNQVATHGPDNMPVTQNQTANYNPATGTVTPNQSSVTPQTMATALYGVTPKDILDNQAQSRTAKIAQGELDLKREIEPKKLGIESAIQTLLAGIKGKESNATITHTENEDTNALLARRAELVKNYPGTMGMFAGNTKAQESRDEVAIIDGLLAKKGINLGGGSNGSSVSSLGISAPLPAVGKTVTHSSGVKITRTK